MIYHLSVLQIQWHIPLLLHLQNVENGNENEEDYTLFALQTSTIKDKIKELKEKIKDNEGICKVLTGCLGTALQLCQPFFPR